MAIKNVIADGYPDAQKILKMMPHNMHTHAMNEKLKRMTHGERTLLDCIKVLKDEWFLSRQSGELLRYKHGVFGEYKAVVWNKKNIKISCSQRYTGWFSASFFRWESEGIKCIEEGISNTMGNY